jgi:hypothetical protein
MIWALQIHLLLVAMPRMLRRLTVDIKVLPMKKAVEIQERLDEIARTCPP